MTVTSDFPKEQKRNEAVADDYGVNVADRCVAAAVKLMRGAAARDLPPAFGAGRRLREFTEFTGPARAPAIARPLQFLTKLEPKYMTFWLMPLMSDGFKVRFPLVSLT